MYLIYMCNQCSDNNKGNTKQKKAIKRDFYRFLCIGNIYYLENRQILYIHTIININVIYI